jgi:hypothetical protein
MNMTSEQILIAILGISVLAGVFFLGAAVLRRGIFRSRKPSPVPTSIVNFWAAMLFLGMPLLVYCRQLEKTGWAWPLVGLLWTLLIGSIIAAVILGRPREV